MGVSIRYCVRWNYKPHAVRVAAELKKALGVSATLIEGDRGEFTVWVGPQRVADKVDGEFPKDQDVVNAVRGALDKANAQRR